MTKQYTRYTSFYFLFTIDCYSKHIESTKSTKYLKGVIHINYHMVQKRKKWYGPRIICLNDTIYPTIFVFVRGYFNICYIWYENYIWYFCCKNFSWQRITAAYKTVKYSPHFREKKCDRPKNPIYDVCVFVVVVFFFTK